MKILKVILLLFLVLKASGGFSMNLFGCCGDKEVTECTTDLSDEEDKGCCGTSCDCMCCGHIFTLNDVTELAFVIEDLRGSFLISFKDNYTNRYTASLWQPPRRF